MKTGYIFHDAFLGHDPGHGHPESPDRLRAVMRSLNESGLADRLVAIPARPASMSELLAVHTPEYLEELKKISQNGGGNLDADTVVSSGSWTAAQYAAGGAVAAVEAMMDGRVSNSIALVRPPGHHAFAQRGSGFCLLNNIAVAAMAARQKYGLKRLAIIDFDVHHGNGTQSIFENDPDMLYISTHQYPHYPGTGWLEDNHSPSAAMPDSLSAINIPLPPGCSDAEYTRIFLKIIMPAVRRFNPELILISAGYDGHWADPLAGMRLTVDGFAAIIAIIKTLADECCGGRLVGCLEGGYHLEALAASIAATFSILLGDSFTDDPLGQPPETMPAPDINNLINELKSIHRL